jgi:preprotein translocase subunit SecY
MEMEKNRNKDELKINKKILIFISIISIVFVVGLWILNYILLKDECNENKAAFGNMFGLINALFSGFAFAGIIITILLQSSELSLQRLYLKDTREGLKRAAEAQEKSEKAL